MGLIFLSHSGEDKAFVRLLASDLESAHVTYWLDEAEIKPGQSLIGKISEGITGAKYVAACLSPNSMKSAWVMTELQIAVTQQIEDQTLEVLPILLPGFEGKRPAFLRHLCYVDFRDPARYEQNLRKLVILVKPSARNDWARDHPYTEVGFARQECLVQAAADPAYRKWVVEHLEACLPSATPTELYWIRAALSRISDSRARELLDTMQEDRSDPRTDTSGTKQADSTGG